MTLTHDNYFSSKAMNLYMSTSQFKAFEKCEAAALAELRGRPSEDKQAYKEGRFFEACLSGDEHLFISQNPDMVSSRGATKGNLKANYQKVIASAEAFKRQPIFSDILNHRSRYKPQIIVNGEIAGVPFKGCIDFLDVETLNGYDTKCMRGFDKVYSDTEKMRVNWYFAYGYNYQAAIYAELLKQMYGASGTQHILAATKEDVPDVAAMYFSDDILDNALDIVKEFAPRYDKIKKGLIEPGRCEKCDYCKQTKVITGFEVVSEFE